MPTGRQDKEFATMIEKKDLVEVSATLKATALDSAIEWISKNLNPDEVFDTKDLENWAESNGFEKK